MTQENPTNKGGENSGAAEGTVKKHPLFDIPERTRGTKAARSAVFAAPFAAKIPIVNVVTLPNGLRVALDSVPSVRSAAFGIWVRNGSRNEDSVTNGISHFYEHMLFKGTERRDARDIADEMDAVGGQLNAFTTKEFTCVFARTLDTHLDIMMDVLADMFFNSRFDDEEIEKERNVILEEISMNEDTPEDLVHDLLASRVWPGHPLGYSVLGTRESIAGFTSETFHTLFKKNFLPETTVLSLSGSFDTDSVLKKIETYFGEFSRNGCSPVPAPADYTPGVVIKEKDIEQLHLAIGLPSIPAGSEDAHVLAVLNALYGGGMSSRLFQKIREERGLVYSVYSCNASFLTEGLFTVYAALNPNRAGDVFRLVADEARAFKSGVTQEQLLRAKEQLKSNYLMSLESMSNRMNSMGSALLMLGRIYSPEEIIQKIDDVTMERLYAMADTLFDADLLSLSAVGKVGGIDFREMIPHE
ncbi:MAG: insulinase family protein [Clostridiales bacterium]|jgi:predicted Zn-dependent peptidase|nr:insulinase family protein [Clostridiales bacterium]